jgi:hypothetical protein
MDRFTETTTTGWFSRIGKSITGLFLGFVLIAVAIGLLWWNEGRTVHTSRGLDEGAKVTVETSADPVAPANEGKLIHVTGQTTLEKPAVDEKFGVTGPDLIKLRRSAQMFQWVEDKKETTRSTAGGGEETVTEYSYVKKWDDKIHDSSTFHRPQGHQNPPPSIKSEDFLAQGVKLGAYRLPKFLLAQWDDFERDALPDPKNLPEGLRSLAKVQGDWLVLSQTPEKPVVGDMRVRFASIKTGDASILARQVTDTLEPFPTSHGTTIARIESGVHSKAAMFAAAHAENNLLAWILRLVGFVVMFFGFLAVFAPLTVIADIVPLAGRIVGAGTGLIAFLLSIAVSATTVALAWLWFRPVLGVGLLVLAGVGTYFLIKALRRSRPRQKT